MAKSGKQIKTFELDCSGVASYGDFIAEVNRSFIKPIDASISWNGNLDALNDFLSWPEGKYEVIFIKSENFKDALSNARTIEEETLYDQIIDVFLSNADCVRLRFK
jgi:hypothetical protein